jgi:hypothetical protein
LVASAWKRQTSPRGQSTGVRGTQIQASLVNPVAAEFAHALPFRCLYRQPHEAGDFLRALSL